MTSNPAGTSEDHAGDGTDPSVQDWPLRDWLGVLLARLIRAAGLLQPDQPLPGLPISLSEGFALAELAHTAPLTQRELAERLDLEKSTISRLVAGLERRGLVTRRRNPENRRYYQLTLTQHGRAAASRLATSMHQRHAQLLAAMTQAERDALATGVTALLRALGQAPPVASPPTATTTPTGNDRSGQERPNGDVAHGQPTAG
jgi:DNA-binding MarR family transcriptional regulator